MKRSERGFTLVEIMIVVAIIALLAAIAIPNVLRGRASANEAAAIGNMHALVSSLEMYRSTANDYPSAWQNDMYTVPSPDFGPPSFNLAITNGAAGLVQGYNYSYNRPATQTYTLVAAPAATNNGTRSVFADESGTVRHCICPAAGCGATTGLVRAKSTDATLDLPPTNPCTAW